MKKLILFFFISFSFLGLVSASNYVLSDYFSPDYENGRVVFYHFDNKSFFGENETLVYDFSGTGNNATIINPSFNSSGGYIGGATEFNGIDVRMRVNNFASASGLTTYSACLWVKGKEVQPSASYLFRTDDDSVGANINVNAGQLRSRLEIVEQDTSALNSNYRNFDFNTWSYLCYVYDSANNKLLSYLNGVPASNVAGSDNSTKVASTNLNIGWEGTSTRYYNGTLDEMMMWNRSLSTTEILNLYNQYASNCIIPYDGMTINESINLCSGDYYLNTSEGNSAITISNANINVSCQGTKLIGNQTINGGVDLGMDVDTRGFRITTDNVTIEGCYLKGYNRGVYATNNRNTNLTNLTLEANYYGILLGGSNTSKITLNNFTKNGVGMWLESYANHNEIKSNIFRDTIEFQSITNYNSSHNIYQYNNFNNQTKAYAIGRSATNISIFDEIINNSYTNFDGWNTGILGYSDLGGSSGVRINNITIDNVGCQGLLIERATNWNVTNITINQLSLQERIDNGVDCRFEAPAGISILELYRTGTSDNNATINDNITIISQYKSSNIIINNVQVNGFDIFLRLQGSQNVTHDFTNYDYLSYQYPTYLVDRDEYFINSSFSNISNTNSIVSGFYNTQMRQGIDSLYLVRIWISKRWQLYRNINETTYNVSLFNLTNALVYNQNDHSLFLSGDLSSNDGDFNVSSAKNQKIVVVNNFTLEENNEITVCDTIEGGWCNEEKPLSFSSSSNTEKTITSTLSESVNATVITINLPPKNKINNITYISANGETLFWSGSSVNSIYNQLTGSGLILELDQGNNLLLIGATTSGQFTCNSVVGALSSTAGFIGIIFLIIIVGILFLFMGGQLEIGFDDLESTTASVVLLAVLIVSGILIISAFLGC